MRAWRAVGGVAIWSRLSASHHGGVSPTILSASFDELSAARLYDILRLRVNTFVVEQECPYPEIDGLDPSARHYWTADQDGVTAYLRVAEQGEQRRIGRVVTRPDARGRGLSAALMHHAIADTEGPWVLDAQAHLEHWYARFGFTRAGDTFLEDGIPHVPMHRPA